MRKLSRRGFSRLIVSAAGVYGLCRTAATAQAAALLEPQGSGDAVIKYALRLVDDPTLDSIYAHLEPNTSSDVVGSIPYGTPVPVIDQADGERIWYGGTTWYRVVMTYNDGWVYGPLLGDVPTDGQYALPLPAPVSTPSETPAPVGLGKSIVVSLADQFLWAFDQEGVAVAVGCSTGGKDLATPTGDFHVLKHERDYIFNSPWPKGSPDWYPSTQASFALLFHNPGYFLHDATWRRVFGPDSQGGDGPPGGDHTGSHGCVNLPYAQARFLYDWVDDGTPVRVV